MKNAFASAGAFYFSIENYKKSITVDNLDFFIEEKVLYSIYIFVLCYNKKNY